MYIVFAYEAYYPGGGWHDMKKIVKHKKDLHGVIKKIMKNKNYFGIHVVSVKKMKVIACFERNKHKEWEKADFY